MSWNQSNKQRALWCGQYIYCIYIYIIHILLRRKKSVLDERHREVGVGGMFRGASSVEGLNRIVEFLITDSAYRPESYC